MRGSWRRSGGSIRAGSWSGSRHSPAMRAAGGRRGGGCKPPGPGGAGPGAPRPLASPGVRGGGLSRPGMGASARPPPVPIAPEDVEPGVHGLIVRHGGRSGLLLPQVATHHGWDRETFLAYTCLKAGLPRDAWRDPGAILLAFTAIVLRED